MGLLIIALVVLLLLSIPVYVIGLRRGVRNAGVAFIPAFGPTIVLLWSIERSGWLCLIGLIPIANWVFSIWLLFSVPAHHGRTRWWGAAFFVPLIGFYAYAFTLPNTPPMSARGAMATP